MRRSWLIQRLDGSLDVDLAKIGEEVWR